MRMKHADMIIEWAETGKEVQRYCFIDDCWVDDDVPGWLDGYKYRFKPTGIKYMVAICTKPDGTGFTVSANTPGEKLTVEKNSYFTKWTTEDWIEVEV